MGTIPTARSFGNSFLPDFARRQWVSDRARALWEPRLTAIGYQLASAERESVALGIRGGALQNVSPELLPELAQLISTPGGLIFTPLEKVPRANGYSASSGTLQGAQPWDYRVAIEKRKFAGQVVHAYQERDDGWLGQTLGYPECCVDFFEQTWGRGSVDPTCHMEGDEGPAEANILLRWLGVRYVPHMPCSFSCEQSVKLGLKFRALIRDRERDWMDELLSMPMLWSCVNGIGEVVTPIVTLNFRSDMQAEPLEIRRGGSTYPKEGAHGLRFPYRPPPARRNVPPLRSSQDESYWRDNGFSSFEEMERAHRTVASIAPQNPGKVIDLGCGNGALARRIAGPTGRAFGVECDDARAKRAVGNVNEVFCADLRTADWSGWAPGKDDVVLLMPGRLVESSAPELLDKLRSIETNLVLYCYGDWLERYGSLSELCSKAGLEGRLSTQALGDQAAAGVWQWA